MAIKFILQEIWRNDLINLLNHVEVSILTWIVGHVDTLVSELSSDLVDSVDAADDQHLVVQLRRDTHEQLHVQVVVVSHERLEKVNKNIVDLKHCQITAF